MWREILLTHEVMSPTFDFDPSLSPSVAAGVRSLIRDCGHLLPSWCDHVHARAADEDVEALTADQAAPLIALPDRPGRRIRLLVRNAWGQSDARTRRASLSRWLILERLLNASGPVLQVVLDLAPASAGAVPEGELQAPDLYLASLAALSDLLSGRVPAC